MNRPQSEPQNQPTQKYPKGYEQLSDEYKAMWDDIVMNHPWFSKDKPKLSNSNN